MNGAHELGGMHGFGPINPEPEDHPAWIWQVITFWQRSAERCRNGFPSA